MQMQRPSNPRWHGRGKPRVHLDHHFVDREPLAYEESCLNPDLEVLGHGEELPKGLRRVGWVVRAAGAGVLPDGTGPVDRQICHDLVEPVESDQAPDVTALKHSAKLGFQIVRCLLSATDAHGNHNSDHNEEIAEMQGPLRLLLGALVRARADVAEITFALGRAKGRCTPVFGAAGAESAAAATATLSIRTTAPTPPPPPLPSRFFFYFAGDLVGDT